MSTITDRSKWPLITQEVRMNKGPLVRVQWPDGHVTKMHEQDAIAQGLLSGKPKARPQPENKMVQPADDKAAAERSPTGQPMPELDDFTSIDGVGLGIARSLAARSITTFAQLRAAKDLSFLSKKAQAAIETWRNG